MEQTDKKISQMPPLQTVSGDEIVPVVKSGGNYSALVSQIVALARQTMVEAQAGKGLSANDFTDALKAKLEGLSNYDDTEVRALITAINGRLDTILGDGASTAIDTFNEIEAFLTGITDTQTLTGLLQQQKQTITNETDGKLAGKVDKVSGKGLSANDYTDEDKAKLGALLGNGQFNVSGYYSSLDGSHVQNIAYRTSGLIVLNTNYPLKVRLSVGTGVAPVSFFDATGKFISAILGSGIKEITNFPAGAVFFGCSTTSDAAETTSFYINGPTHESREGAMAEALASLGGDKLDKEKWDAEHEQFTIKGYFLGKRGNLSAADSEITGVTPLLPLSKTYPIVLKNVLARGNAVAVGFYDAVGTFISYPEGIEDLNGDFTVTSGKYPENACFFRVCTEKTGSSYSNGNTVEAHDDAATQAIRAAKLALFVDEFNAAAGANGKYDPANAPDAEHPFYLNTLWLTYNEAVASMAHINEIYLRGAVSMSGLIIRTNMLSAKTTPSGWGTGFVILNSVCSLNGTIEVLNVGNIALDKVDNMGMFAYGCSNLHTIIGKISMYQTSSVDTSAFAASPKLQDVRLYRLKTSISFKDCPLLSLATLQYLVDNSANTAPITVTVHPVTYGKLTDEQADIMALLPENLLGGISNHSGGVTVIDGGIEITATRQYVRFNHSPHLVNKGLGKLTIACDVEGLGDGELIKLAVGATNDVPRPEWIISANGRAVFSFDTSAYSNDSTSSNSFLLYDNRDSFNGQSVKLTNFKLSYGEHDALPYTPPLSSITDDATREKAEWLSLMQIAEARQINFVTTE